MSREYDAVLGSPNWAPEGAMVLGGFAGVQRRFASPVVEVRTAALQEALKYGEQGISLLLEGMKDDAETVQHLAYRLLRTQAKDDSQIQHFLKAYLPYKLFECLTTRKVGSDAVLSPNGEGLAYVKGKKVYVYPLMGTKPVFTIPAVRRSMYALCPDFTLIRVKNGSTPGIEIWQQGELQHTLFAHQDQITALAISEDGKTLATGGADARIYLWNIAKGKLVGTYGNHLTLGAHTGSIIALTFSPDGRKLASSSRDCSVKLWDLPTGDRLCTLKTYSPCLALSPDGITLATVNWSGEIQLWDISTPCTIGRFPGVFYGVKVMQFTPYGRLLLSAGGDRRIHFWDVYQKMPFHTLTRSESPCVTTLQLLADSQQLITIAEDKTLTVWGIL